MHSKGVHHSKVPLPCSSQGVRAGGEKTGPALRLCFLLWKQLSLQTQSIFAVHRWFGKTVYLTQNLKVTVNILGSGKGAMTSEFVFYLCLRHLVSPYSLRDKVFFPITMK